MKQKIRQWMEHHKQLILYLLFGVITTVCSMAACYFTLKLGVLLGWDDGTGDPTMGLDILGSTTQWIVGVLVAFWTNKKWVFVDAERGLRVGFRQFLVFSGSRVLTYFLEVGINLGSIAVLEAIHLPEPTLHLLGMELDLTVRIWAKLISSVVIVVSNYFVSKLLVFRKKSGSARKKDESGESGHTP
ncbi:MAG: GtrA family protein [Clostridia bacterium]|nr:GtrA family protein [Clostridia bacterium]